MLGCSKWSEKSSQYCNSCIYINSLLGFNKTELAKVGLTSTLTEVKLNSLYRTTHCEISGLPMIFKANSGLKAISIDRINKNIGLTDSNTRLVLTGLNQLRSYTPYPLFLDFLNLTDTCIGKDIEISNKTEKRLRELL